MALESAFEPSMMNSRGTAGSSPRSIKLSISAWTTAECSLVACEKIFEDLKQRNLTKIGMISGTDGFGSSMRTQCTKVAPNYGIQIVTEESYGPRDSDMSAQLTKIKNTAGI